MTVKCVCGLTVDTGSIIGDFQLIVDLNSKVRNGAFQLGMAWQELDGPKRFFVRR